MIYKKIMLGALISVTISHRMLSAGTQTTVKTSIKAASQKATWGWLKARGIPMAVGATMFALPPTAGIIGFAGALGESGGSNQTNFDIFIGMMAGGYLLSYVLMPAGALMMARQGFLIKRDIGLLYKFTNSTARLNTTSLPEAFTIGNMNNHHQLLTMARDYFSIEGNILEQRMINTWGFRGYKPVAPEVQ